MQLVGLLRSPFVRRVAISLKYYGVVFEHYPLSTYDDYDTLAEINPAVKTPTMILDNGEVLMDSSLILSYFESQASTTQKLMPSNPYELAHDLQAIGMTLAACERLMLYLYETNHKPADKQYQPWIKRLKKQVSDAFRSIEDQLEEGSDLFFHLDQSISQAAITVAVAWTFAQYRMPKILVEKDFPMLAAFTYELESQSIFMDTPIT